MGGRNCSKAFKAERMDGGIFGGKLATAEVCIMVQTKCQFVKYETDGVCLERYQTSMIETVVKKFEKFRL